MRTPENGTTRRTSDFRRGALEVLLLEALLGPVHQDLLQKTLQDHVLGENQDLHRDASCLLPPAPPPRAQEPTSGLLQECNVDTRAGSGKPPLWRKKSSNCSGAALD